MTNTCIFHVILLLNVINTLGSYVPPHYVGSPVTMGVTALDPPNFTGKSVYRIEFSLETEDENGIIYTNGFIHRLEYNIFINILKIVIHIIIEFSKTVCQLSCIFL